MTTRTEPFESCSTAMANSSRSRLSCVARVRTIARFCPSPPVLPPPPKQPAATTATVAASHMLPPRRSVADGSVTTSLPDPVPGSEHLIRRPHLVLAGRLPERQRVAVDAPAVRPDFPRRVGTRDPEDDGVAFDAEGARIADVLGRAVMGRPEPAAVEGQAIRPDVQGQVFFGRRAAEHLLVSRVSEEVAAPDAHLPRPLERTCRVLARRLRAARTWDRRGGGDSPLQGLDPAESMARVRIALELRVDRGNRAPEACELRRSHVGEHDLPPCAERLRPGGVLLLRRSHGLGDRGGRSVTQRLLLLWVKRAEDLRRSEDDERARPEVEVRCEVPRRLVVLVSDDRAHLLLDPVEASELRLREDLSRAGAERTHGFRSDDALDTDGQASEVARIHEGTVDAQKLSHRPGENADPDDSGRLRPREHLSGDPTLEDALLERIAVDQKRRDQGVEAPDPDPVPGAGADPGELDLGRLHVTDRVQLLAEIGGAPVVLELDPNRPARAVPDLLGEARELLRRAALNLARQGQDDRVLPTRATRLAAATATAAHDDNSDGHSRRSHAGEVPHAAELTLFSGRVCDDRHVALARYLNARRVGRPAIGLAALAFGLLTLARARHDPGGSFAGTSTLGAIAELGAGWSLVATGLLFWERHSRNWFGPLLAASGFAWFLPEWSNPGVGTAVGFSVGLVGFAGCAPLVGHAVLAYPSGG